MPVPERGDLVIQNNKCKRINNMKTNSTIKVSIFLLSLMSAFTLQTAAQKSRFGISFNSLTTNFYYGSSNSALQVHKKNYRGIQAGVYYQAGISPRFSLVPELYFASKGAILEQGNPLTGNKSTLRISSLELPVLARVHFGHLYLNTGPYGAYNLAGKMKIAATETLPGSSTKISFGQAAEDFRRWDLGVQAGAGYNFDGRRSVLTIDVRYGHGLANLSRDVARYNRMLNISVQVAKVRPGRF